MLPGKPLQKMPRSSQGFTLFEMVVVICVIVILYMVAAQRLSELPAAAERASFYGTLGQIKAGVNFEMISKLTSQKSSELRNLSGANPMAFLLETPNNYRGEQEWVNDRNAQRGGWYYETSSGELVYVISGSSINDVFVELSGMMVNYGQIRLKLTNIYKGNGVGQQGNWQGLSLVEVMPFRWERRQDLPIGV